jgi:hypothetical protein
MPCLQSLFIAMVEHPPYCSARPFFIAHAFISLHLNLRMSEAGDTTFDNGISTSPRMYLYLESFEMHAVRKNFWNSGALCFNSAFMVSRVRSFSLSVVVLLKMLGLDFEHSPSNSSSSD